MGWFNYYGLAVMAIVMIPNIVYAVKRKPDASAAYHNKTLEIFEQIGRYCCFVLMIFNIPYLYFPVSVCAHGLFVGKRRFLPCVSSFLDNLSESERQIKSAFAFYYPLLYVFVQRNYFSVRSAHRFFPFIRNRSYCDKLQIRNLR